MSLSAQCSDNLVVQSINLKREDLLKSTDCNLIYIILGKLKIKTDVRIRRRMVENGNMFTLWSIIFETQRLVLKEGLKVALGSRTRTVKNRNLFTLWSISFETQKRMLKEAFLVVLDCAQMLETKADIDSRKRTVEIVYLMVYNF